MLTTLTDQCTFNILSLLDFGTTGCYLDEGFTQAKGLFLEKLPRAVPVYNANGSFNAAGPIRYLTSLHVQIDNHDEVITFAVTNLGKSDMSLGFDWLQKHNPTVDWCTGHLLFNCCPNTCTMNAPLLGNGHPVSYLEEGDRLWVTKIYGPENSDSYICALYSGEQQLVQELRKPLSDLLPEYCISDFSSVFEKTEFDKLLDQ